MSVGFQLSRALSLHRTWETWYPIGTLSACFSESFFGQGAWDGLSVRIQLSQTLSLHENLGVPFRSGPWEMWSPIGKYTPVNSQLSALPLLGVPFSAKGRGKRFCLSVRLQLSHALSLHEKRGVPFWPQGVANMVPDWEIVVMHSRLFSALSAKPRVGLVISAHSPIV